MLPGYAALPEAARRVAGRRAGPADPGLASTDRPQVGHFTDSDAVLDFLGPGRASRGSPRSARPAPITSCAPRSARWCSTCRRTRRWSDVIERLRELHAEYRTDYAAYYDRHAVADSPAMRGADPAIVLVPGVGMFSFGANKQTARVAGEFYVNAINVMRGAEAISTYAPIDEAEKFRIEYWLLEEAKLRADAQAEGAGGAGRAGHRRRFGHRTGDRPPAGRRGCVRRDRRPERRQRRHGRRRDRQRRRRGRRQRRRQQTRTQIAAAFAAAALAFGGVDLVVNNAGLSISKPLAETTVADWDLQHDVMARGSFLVSREAARVMREQGMGGDIVYISSKNSVFAGPNNVAYGAAKADQAHQVRLLAAELGRDGIRVNGINPDGVVRGSGIFAGGWGAQRAAVYGVPEEELGAFYAQRTLLKREVLPEHIADRGLRADRRRLAH